MSAPAYHLHGHISDTIPPPFRSVRSKLQNWKHWEYVIQDGFWISSLNYEFRENVNLKYKIAHPVLNFGFILSGSYIHRVKITKLIEQKFIGSDGTSGIVYFPSPEGELIIPGQTPVHVVHIHLSVPFFHSIFCHEKECVPKGLKPILHGTLDQPYAFLTGMSLKVRSALTRLIKPPSPGVPTSLSYQGIALCLIAEQIARANSCSSNQEKIRCDNQRQLIRARDLLIRDLVSPPNLKQLAKKTGLNINKLQKGFNLLYGVSVNKYLQQCRMKEANRLFHETEMNVSQIASEVGYTNASHFSTAYKKHFGILPKRHLICIREHL